MIKRWMLARRRYDAGLLALAVAMLAIGDSIGKWIFIFFGLLGINLFFARHRVLRYVDLPFCLVIATYVAWTIGLMLWRHEPYFGNRFLSYAGIIFGFVFLAPALALIRHPLDALILGARIGILAILALLPFDVALSGGRVGLGLNEAIFAFLAAGVGLSARMKAVSPPRFLPNSRWWLYASFIPVLGSETRAAWFVYGLVLCFDLFAMATRGFVWRGTAGQRWALAAIGFAVAVASVPASLIVVDRYEKGLQEITAFDRTGVATGSVDVRIVMWKAAVSIIREHPVVGIGSTRRVEAVAERVNPENAAYVRSFTHLHNIFIDEATSSGLVGLTLLMAIFAVFLYRAVRGGNAQRVAETSVAFVVLVMTFGFFHGVLLNEWMIILIFGFMTIVLTEFRRDAFRRRIRTSLRSVPA